ncbi:MAG: endopeptidase La, partial [Rhodobacterales bacterium]
MAKKNKITQPVLPLRDIVVFPNMIVRLFVGRDKSVRALEEVMKDNKEILLASQIDATQDEPTEESINKVGVTANVLQILKLPDGAVKILVEGKNRVKIEKFIPNKDFFEAEATILNDTINKLEEIEALRRSVIDEFDRYSKLNK